MPFQSEKQKKFMFANHPDIAHKWAHGEHSTTQGNQSEKDKKAKARLEALRKKANKKG